MGKLILIILLFLTNSFSSPTVSGGFVGKGLADVFSNSAMEKTLAKTILNYSDLNFDYIFIKQLNEIEMKNELKDEIVKVEQSKGFIKSHRVQVLKSGKFKAASRLTFKDGIKNGYIVIFGGFADFCKGIINIFTGKQDRVNYLVYNILSLFTRISNLFFMASANMFGYYIGFVISLICSGILLLVLLAS